MPPNVIIVKPTPTLKLPDSTQLLMNDGNASKALVVEHFPVPHCKIPPLKMKLCGIEVLKPCLISLPCLPTAKIGNLAITVQSVVG